MQTPQQAQNLKYLEIDGLTLSAHPLTTKQEIKQVFKVDLLERGVLPIKLKAEYRNPSTSFLIDKDKVVIMTETTHATNSSGEIAKQLATHSWSRGQQLRMAASLSPVLFLIAAMRPTEGPIVFKADEENLSGKEFLTRTLAPGQMAEGFVYFQYTNCIDATNAYHIVSEIKNLSTEEIISFDLKVNLYSNNP